MPVTGSRSAVHKSAVISSRLYGPGGALNSPTTKTQFVEGLHAEAPAGTISTGIKRKHLSTPDSEFNIPLTNKHLQSHQSVGSQSQSPSPHLIRITVEECLRELQQTHLHLGRIELPLNMLVQQLNTTGFLVVEASILNSTTTTPTSPLRLPTEAITPKHPEQSQMPFPVTPTRQHDSSVTAPGTPFSPIPPNPICDSSVTAPGTPFSPIREVSLGIQREVESEGSCDAYQDISENEESLSISHSHVQTHTPSQEEEEEEEEEEEDSLVWQEVANGVEPLRHRYYRI
ncbi:hypothetical protein M422DRAFT_267784 [Sphaerobolus stellatus SS14]|uniref:Unplaced genomic scaffold SPHSTscaffold_182, whole genome shotgun sequence n=1 Tax=Sphaerobolus stellatus (strain SS14) TaxID=990650 RepID=A0A0C9TL97_SPHS4|nr:hypothetical protein M422DRAFT_267784 [Sphaerobolus stellatus SS14]